MDENLPVRRFLFLQGPSSPFFSRLARVLRDQGHETRRVGACPGDRLYWWPGSGPYHAWRGRPRDWPAAVRDLIATYAITDIVCLGDGRAFHRDAIAAAREAPHPVRVSIVEQGYLRPGLLTVEPDGTGGRSHVPAMFAAGHQPEFAQAEPAHARSIFLVYAGYDVAYHLANLAGAAVFYPHYRNHALHGTLAEWRGWIGKALSRARRRRARDEALARIAAHDGRLFVLPLQLETDYQIRDHGYRGGLTDALNDTVASFLAHAPDDALLVVKVHPLDNGLAPWAKRVAEAAGKAFSDRVLYLDGGDLDAMLVDAAGVVTVNSTVGLTALAAGCPVKTLGTAIYDLPGMTHDAPLDGFWSAPKRPDAAMVARFLTFLRGTVQVPGAFEGEGALSGAKSVADRLLAPPAFSGKRDQGPSA